MAEKHVPPSIASVSFSCPHCGAHAHQTWYKVYAKRLDRNGTPERPGAEELEWVRSDAALPVQVREKLSIIYFERCIGGEIFLGDRDDALYQECPLVNVSVSGCYSCERLSVWINSRVVYPPLRHGVEPNADLPEEVIRDYDEARSIVDLSPRMAAALLRLAIQKICIFLGEPGKKIDDDIASLPSNRQIGALHLIASR
jgi:hypothetical protein